MPTDEQLIKDLNALWVLLSADQQVQVYYEMCKQLPKVAVLNIVDLLNQRIASAS